MAVSRADWKVGSKAARKAAKMADLMVAQMVY